MADTDPQSQSPATKRSTLSHQIYHLRRGIIAIIIILTIAAFGLAFWYVDMAYRTGHRHADAPLQFTHTLTFAITDDPQQATITLGEILGTIADQAGTDGQLFRDRLTWSVNLDPPNIRRTIQSIERQLEGIVSVTQADDKLQLTFDRAALRRKNKAVRAQWRQFIRDTFPDQAALADLHYTLRLHEPINTSADPDHVVVLVHGLDEPGFVWNDLRPTLLEQGYRVGELVYPNDQTITDSTALLARELATLHNAGVTHITLIAHSMGGLVCRDLLTDPQYLANQNQRPAVDRLIMIGTPNYGSEVAHLRGFSELRDHAVQMFSGDGMLFGAVLDGAGEAMIDLLPHSDFLTALNNRPHPENIPYTIIAGSASPIDADLIRADRILGQRAKNDLLSLVDGVGDGAVSIRSAQLAGVHDFHLVSANHLSLIRHPNLPHLSTRSTPPAIPIILNRLPPPTFPLNN